MDEDKSFAKLKYEIVDIEDDSTWKLCETYPDPVKKEWAWRCALDVEHFANKSKIATKCIETAKRFREGLASKEELLGAQEAVNDDAAGGDQNKINSAMAAYAFYYAVDGPFWAIQGVHYAATASKKKKEYKDWLIEELGKHDTSE